MATWNDVYEEIMKTKKIDAATGMCHLDTDSIIKKYIGEFARLRKRNVIVYYSDWLNRIKGPNIDINDGDMDAFMNAVCGLDKM